MSAEPLLLLSFAANCILIGLYATMFYIHKSETRARLAQFAELAKIKSEFNDTVAKAADVNNGLVKQVSAMQDTLMAHEMQLRGTRK